MGGGLSALASASSSSDDLPVLDPSQCTHKFCEKWGPDHFHCCDCHTQITDAEHIANENDIIDGIVDNSTPEDGVYRGVTIQFLIDFANACKCWDMTTRDVRRRFVMPATRASRSRFVELPEMSGSTGKATMFVSHTWGAKFGDLVAAVADGDADRSRIVWVDIFAVRQWPSHKPDLDFSAVVKQCQAFMIVCSSHEDIVYLNDDDKFARKVHVIPPHIRAQIAFLRVWCLVEVHAAIVSGATIVMKGGNHEINGSDFSFVTVQWLLLILCHFIDIESAEATVESDKHRILHEINSSGKGVAAVNEAVRGLLAGGALASKQPVLQCAACGDKNALATIEKSPTDYVVSAAACGYVHLLQLLIDKGGDITVDEGGGSRTCLSAAAAGGHANCIELLLKHGCDVNYKDGQGQTALLPAAMLGHVRVVEMLIAAGCDATVTSKEGMNALMLSAFGGHAACAAVLAKHCDLNATCCGMTAVMAAARSGHVECLKVLVEAGCDLTLQDDNGDMALDMARLAMHSSCVEVLSTAMMSQ